MNDAAYKNITARLKKISRRYFLYNISGSACYAFALFAALTSVSAIFESALYLPPQVKKYLFFFSIIIPVILFVWLLVCIILRRPDNDEMSRMVERAYPFLNNTLISAVQLGRLSESELAGQSEDIIHALIEKVDKVTGEQDFPKSVPADSFLFPLKIALCTILVVLLASVLAPGNMIGGFLRLADYTRMYISPERTKIYTAQRAGSIIRGDNFDVSGFVAGDRSEELKIFFKWDGSGIWNTKPVSVDGINGDFTAVIERPRSSFRYYLETNGVKTSEFEVITIERPDVERFEISLEYPEYTGAGTIKTDNSDGNIRVLKGTDVSITLTANKPLKQMSIFWSDSTVSVCPVEGIAGTASFKALKTVDYRFGLIDSLGIRNINPITYRFTCYEDENPVVSIMSPAGDIVMHGSMKLPVTYSAGDDYGITNIFLRFKLPYEDESREIPLHTLQNFVTDFEDTYDWNLSGLNMLPGDIVPFNLVVYDNDSLGGPKEGISETINVRLPSMTDLMKESVEEQNASIEKLREISGNAAEQDKKLDVVNRNIKSNKELDWSDKTAIEESKQNLKNMQKEVMSISESVKKIADRLTDENMAAVETLEKLRQISEIIDDIAEGEIKEALKQLTQANIEIDPAKIKQALDRYKLSAEDLKKKLDRIIDFLEKVKSIQRFEMAGNLLEDMASKQAEMAQKYNIDPDNPAYPREEKILAEEMKKIQDELTGAAQDLRETFKLNTTDFEESIRVNDAAEIKRKASEQMRDGLTQNAEKSLSQSNSMISELLEKHDALGASMKAANSAEVKMRLFEALNKMLFVSREQEYFLKDNENLDNEKLAQSELEIIDAVIKTEKSLVEFGRIFIEISGIVDQMMTSTKMMMRNAVDFYAAGKPGEGEKNARNALKSLNGSIHFLTLLLQQEENAQNSMGMPGDLMQQLQNIANGQMSLNGRMGSEMMEQLAAEQQKLAEMLSKLGEQVTGDKNLSELLQKLAEEMDDTGNMMRKNEKREFVERKQLDIYRRILDARRSRRQKNEADERKSMAAKRNISSGADSLPIDLGEKNIDLNLRIKEAMQGDFDPEYMRLIRGYFESLLGDDMGGGQ